MSFILRSTICILSILILSFPAIAAECKSELTGLTVYFLSKGNEWSKTWKADGVHKEKVAYYANFKDRTSAFNASPGGDKRSETLPQTLLPSDKRFNSPFDISQNKELLIAAIHNKTGVMSLPKQLAIVNLKEQKIVQMIENEYCIESLAWAPDGKYFAVLYTQDVTKQIFKGPLDWLAEYLGHGNYYWTFYLTLYQPDGTPLCTEQVEKKLPNAMGYIDWAKQ